MRFLVSEVPLYQLGRSVQDGGFRRKMEYRGTSLLRSRTPLGPYSRPMPKVLRWS